jgi:FOG: FHA domain
MLGRVAGTDSESLNYIVIPQTTIGRRHALIEYKDFSFWIIDQGSINGTFVNNQIITGETRLKHGDKIRLHKYEFEFAMPEMGDAGKTVISHTMIGGKIAENVGEKTVARASAGQVEEATNLPEPDFDLLMDDVPDKNEQGTVFKGSSSAAAGSSAGEEDETLMMDSDGSKTDSTSTDATLRPEGDDSEDHTIDNFHDDDKTR